MEIIKTPCTLVSLTKYTLSCSVKRLWVERMLWRRFRTKCIYESLMWAKYEWCFFWSWRGQKGNSEIGPSHKLWVCSSAELVSLHIPQGYEARVFIFKHIFFPYTIYVWWALFFSDIVFIWGKCSTSLDNEFSKHRSIFPLQSPTWEVKNLPSFRNVSLPWNAVLACPKLCVLPQNFLPLDI